MYDNEYASHIKIIAYMNRVIPRVAILFSFGSAFTRNLKFNKEGYFEKPGLYCHPNID